MSLVEGYNFKINKLMAGAAFMTGDRVNFKDISIKSITPKILNIKTFLPNQTYDSIYKSNVMWH